MVPRLKVLSSVLTAFLLTFTFLSAPTEANAAPGSGALSIVASGGSPVNSGWTYSGGVLEVTSNSSISINASDIVYYLSTSDLIVSAASIQVNSAISSSSINDLTLQALGNINVSGGVNISTNGGDITLQSNSANSGVGSIRLGASTDANTGVIDSNGGRILLSGGSNPLTGYAMASSDLSTGKPAAGVAAYGFIVRADAGSIIVRGSSGANGSTTTRAVLFETNVAGRQTFETISSGTISIVGDGSSIGFNNPWGITTSGANFTTVNGQITLTGKANTAIANARGLAITNATFSSTDGDIFLDDITNGSSANYSGMYVGGGTTSFSTLGNVVIRADEYISDGTLSFSGPSAVLKSYTGVSFTEARPLGLINLANCQNFTFGQPGNTTSVNINQPLTAGGSMTFYGGNISIGGALTATNSNIYLYSSGSVTQSSPISSNGLALVGTGATFTLSNASNNVSTLAGGSSGGRLGAVTFTDSAGGLTIGQVSSLIGLYSSAVVNIATTTGNLSLSESISSNASSGDSVLLYANKSATSGNAGSGDVVVSANGNISINVAARALIYSGTRTSSTGLVTLVGGETNTRSLVDATTLISAINPSIGSSGIYALFRTNTPAPTYTITYNGNQSTGGSAPTATSGSYSQTVEANSGNLERTGFTFSGWNTQADGNGTNYASGDSITPTSNITLYAKWVAVPAPTPSPTPTPGPTVSPASLPLTGVNLEPAMVGAVFTLTLGIVLAALAGLRRKK
jgi:uncharacterized repeat protein (TIGR02543 family)